MKKKLYLFMLCLFTLFIPKVYAMTYDINVDADVLVKAGSKKEINVSISNVKDTTDGVSVCTMNILFDKNIELESSPRTLGDWSMTTGSMYLFDTGSPVKDKSDIFKIPVVVNGEGTVQLKNIVCSDGIEEVKINDKSITFSIKKEELQEDNKTDNSDNVNNDEENELKSNCNLSNIELSDGSIEFDPNVTEYEVNISNFDNFEVYPKLEDDKSSSYVLDKNVTTDGGKVVIKVTAENGDVKTYTIYTIVENNDVIEEPVKKNNYIPIFIGIIVVLVLINVIRIVNNSKKK